MGWGSEYIEVKNAVITSASLTTADHGLLSSWVHLDYGVGGQGFGGYALYLPEGFTKRSNQPNFAGHWMWRVMEVAGVEDWAKLPGKTVRVRANRGKVFAIGHIVKDIWFDPSAEFKAMKGDHAESPQA